MASNWDGGMKFTTMAIIIVTSGLAMTEQARGNFLDGNDLYAKCTAPASFAHCVGYIEGILDAGETEAGFASSQQDPGVPWPKGIIKGTLGGFRWCLRETVTAGQAVDVVTQFLRDNASRRDGGGASLVAWAFAAGVAVRPVNAAAPAFREMKPSWLPRGDRPWRFVGRGCSGVGARGAYSCAKTSFGVRRFLHRQ
jgi:hypothetical protein